MTGVQTCALPISAFTELINSGSDETFSKGFRVVAAYPYGSKTIQSSYERIPGYIEKVKANGVEITSSIADLLEKVDCVLLETNDGRLHLEQAVEVFKSGKICYIDKPVGATLGDAIAIYEMAEKYNAPVFSSSALRFTPQNQKLRNGEFGKILGADCYSPHKVEPTHPDFGFYGIHGVETLYTIMGTGCESVNRMSSDRGDVVVGRWKDGRIGTFRAIIKGDKIRSLMVSQGIDAALITCNANLIYTYGCVVSGYLYLPLHSPALLFFKRPNNITGEHSFSIRKPEQIVDLLKEQGLPMPTKLMLEGDELPYTEYCRLAGLFPEAEVVNGTPLIRQARSVKTPVEIEMFRRSGIAHAKAYEQIPGVYRPGMTDIEFSIEIERLMRLQGCLGIFRVFGRSMEIFMGSVLTGDNAGYPSPYDFALGGQGLDPALPGGANKTPLKEGQSVMVDLGGNFNGYMNDMSRVFSIGKLPEEAYTAHQVCLDIQEKIASIARPGIACEVLYDTAVEVVKAAGFADKFMGTGQQAKFIGHGIGLEINEAPVLAPRIKQQLEPGMVFALEPKIVIPGVGPVGIENSWVVTNEGIEKLTNCNEEIIELS